MFAGHQRAAAPRRIHVQPQFVLFANVGDFGDGVEGTDDSGTRGGTDHERRSTFTERPFYFLHQVRNVHSATRIGPDQVDVVGADPQERGQLLDGVVRVLGGEEDEPGESVETFGLEKSNIVNKNGINSVSGIFKVTVGKFSCI